MCDPRNVARPLGAAAEHCLDPRQQLLDAERLHDVIVGAVREPADPIGLLAAGGEDDDRQRRPQPADFPQNLQPVALRQHQVQQQQIELPRGGHFQARLAVGRLDRLVPGEPQGIDDPPPDRRIVLDGENLQP